MSNEIPHKTLFDLAVAVRLKEEGIARASNKTGRAQLIALGRQIARIVCLERERLGEGWVTSDDVAREMEARGIAYDQLGNAAGGVFRSTEFEPTGQFRSSTRVGSHARMIRVWRLKCPAATLARNMHGGLI